MFMRDICLNLTCPQWKKNLLIYSSLPNSFISPSFYLTNGVHSVTHHSHRGSRQKLWSHLFSSPLKPNPLVSPTDFSKIYCRAPTFEPSALLPFESAWNVTVVSCTMSLLHSHSLSDLFRILIRSFYFPVWNPLIILKMKPIMRMKGRA